MKRILEAIKNFFYGVLVALFTIGISTIISLNLKFIYNLSIDKYNLDKVGQVSKEMLIKDYSTLINYLQNPFVDKLKFENFSMSNNGEFHFYEVKKIFLSIYLLTFIILIFFIILFIIRRNKKKKNNIYKLFNYGVNTLTCIIVVLLSAIFIDFSKAFIIFHKIFFNNDYWIFDERTDPIIKVLPEEVFMLYAIVIIFIIIANIFICKLYYYKKTFSKKNKEDKSISA
ncbi:TIGR01906 family membrane protein [Clostridium nigeriense]|uniref:TIGR01906 family membrane protein n=1 Tax=Clostridium nigeriense TaxID=1805470 RepID=UPI003D32B15D